MLTIRKAQKDALLAQRRESFHARLTHLIRQSSTQQKWDDQRISEEANAALVWARDCHLRRETDIARLAEIFVMRLGGFKTARVPREGVAILYRYDVDPHAKLDGFIAYLDNYLSSRHDEFFGR